MKLPPFKLDQTWSKQMIHSIEVRDWIASNNLKPCIPAGSNKLARRQSVFKEFTKLTMQVVKKTLRIPFGKKLLTYKRTQTVIPHRHNKLKNAVNAAPYSS